MTGENVLPFNPLDKRHLGESVGQALLRQPVVPLSEIPAFIGAGIYALYYTGKFPAYEPLASANSGGSFCAPIYVGRAVPKGARKGSELNLSPGRVLQLRLKQHARSILEAKNLEIDDFQCRYLAVDDIWIPLGESLMIARFTPIWNTLIDGFGNHDPGKGRHAGVRPRWDVLHPGRKWADKCKPREESAASIIVEASTFLRDHLSG